jgi:hypothetical protein
MIEIIPDKNTPRLKPERKECGLFGALKRSSPA